MPNRHPRHRQGRESERPRESPHDARTDDLPDNEETNSPNPKAKKKHRITNYGFRWIILTVDFCIFVAAVIYSGFAYQQWQSMSNQVAEMRRSTKVAEDSLKFARENARVDQRAWISCTEAKGVAEANKALVVSIIFKNTGRTFAKNLKIVMGWQWSDVEADMDFTGVDEENPVIPPNGSAAIIPPGGEYIATTTVRYHQQFSPEEIEEITSHRKTVFIYGRLTYDDVFRCNHWTTFAFFLAPNLKLFVIDRHHNDTDNNPCP